MENSMTLYCRLFFVDNSLQADIMSDEFHLLLYPISFHTRQFHYIPVAPLGLWAVGVGYCYTHAAPLGLKDRDFLLP